MKDRVLVIVPTRSRPESTQLFFDLFQANSTKSDLAFCLDDDDESVYPRIPGVIYEVNPRLRLCGTINLIAKKYAEDYKYVAFMADDHRIRTPGWDAVMTSQSQKQASICYGDDLLQGARLPTAVLMTSNIVRALGFMAPPQCVHLYLDNFWLDLGNALGILSYFPEVIIEHMHYSNGKSEMDAIYADANSSERFSSDCAAYHEYLNSQFASDIEKVRPIL
jgi:hypothetical protein